MNLLPIKSISRIVIGLFLLILPVQASTEFSTQPKPRILVFTDPGGGGHKSASAAVNEILKDRYEINIEEPLALLPFSSVYNLHQRKGRMRMLQFLIGMQPVAEWVADHFAIRNFITREILNYKPDLIISVIPLINYLTKRILDERHLNIPFLILTTDFEAQHFFKGMKHPDSSVKVSLPFDDETLKKPLRKYLSDENFISLGFPLRTAFGMSDEELDPKIQFFRQKFSISESDQVVLMMMGAQGTGETILKYTQLILNSSLGSDDNKLHVITICGKNEELKQKVEALASQSNSNHIIVHPIGEERSGEGIAALMRLANVFISKPGGGSTNEAFASNLYTLYHTDPPHWPFTQDQVLPWERGNMNYSIQRNRGEKIRGKKEFISQLEKALSLPRLQVEDCPGRNFRSNLNQFVQKVLNQPDPIPLTEAERSSQN